MCRGGVGLSGGLHRVFIAADDVVVVGVLLFFLFLLLLFLVRLLRQRWQRRRCGRHLGLLQSRVHLLLDDAQTRLRAASCRHNSSAMCSQLRTKQ